MKAQNLTVCVPTTKQRCDKNCPYCISTITWQTLPNPTLIQTNMPKVKRVADSAGVCSVLVTSKGEPFLNPWGLFWTLNQFKDYWLEIQTNGIQLRTHIHDMIPKLVSTHVNVIALSIDKISEINDAKYLIETLSKWDIITRLCVNVTDILMCDKFKDIMKVVENVGNVRQVLFRNINYPSTADPENPAVEWIDNHTPIGAYSNLAIEMLSMGLNVIREIPLTIIKTYDYNGISVCFSDYCIQESNQSENIRSLILQEDGHLYTNWNSPASILF